MPTFGRTAGIFVVTALALLGQAPLSFEVASIRLHSGPLMKIRDLRISGPRVTLEGYSTAMLIMDAYGPEGFQVLTKGLKNEGDVRETLYNIAARAPGDAVPSRTEVREMLQNLLQTRFHLQMRREKREFSVLALRKDRNGTRVKASSAEGKCSIHTKVQTNARLYLQEFENCGIDEIGKRVSGVGTGKPVIDETGLQGRYDFRLLYTPEFLMAKQEEPGDVSVEDAVKTLGFRLEPRKSMLETIVVEQVTKPDAN